AAEPARLGRHVALAPAGPGAVLDLRHVEEAERALLSEELPELIGVAAPHLADLLTLLEGRRAEHVDRDAGQDGLELRRRAVMRPHRGRALAGAHRDQVVDRGLVLDV